MTKRTITVCSCLLSLAQNDRAILVADVVTFKELKPSHSVIALANTGTGERIVQHSLSFDFKSLSWSVITHHFHNQHTINDRFLKLRDAIITFERQVGVTLPGIRFVEQFVIPHSNTPILLEDGKRYRQELASGDMILESVFTATLKFGQMWLAMDNPDDPDDCITFQPETLFGNFGCLSEIAS